MTSSSSGSFSSSLSLTLPCRLGKHKRKSNIQQNSGITFKLVSGSTELNANAATIESVSWTASLGTASGIARSKYYFNNFCVKKNGQWSSNIGSTNISNWTVGSSSVNGTIDRASAFDVPDGTVSSPSTFKGLGGSELKCRISIGNTTD